MKFIRVAFCLMTVMDYSNGSSEHSADASFSTSFERVSIITLQGRGTSWDKSIRCPFYSLRPWGSRLETIAAENSQS